MPWTGSQKPGGRPWHFAVADLKKGWTRLVFEIFMMVGWTLFGLIMLSLWADMREMKQDLKTYRRDLMRNQLGGRTSENYPGFSEEEYWRSAREEMALEEEAAPEEPARKEKRKEPSLKPGEEQVVREILSEFLG